jgi:hypothetical protein
VAHEHRACLAADRAVCAIRRLQGRKGPCVAIGCAWHCAVYIPCLQPLPPSAFGWRCCIRLHTCNCGVLLEDGLCLLTCVCVCVDTGAAAVSGCVFVAEALLLCADGHSFSSCGPEGDGLSLHVLGADTRYRASAAAAALLLLRLATRAGWCRHAFCTIVSPGCSQP